MTPLAVDLRTAAGLLALQSLPRVGPATALRLALGAAQRPRLLAGLDRCDFAEAFAVARTSVAGYEDAGVQLVTFFDERYPNRLRQIDNPPPLLFVLGNVDLLRRHELVAVVGTRQPTSFGVGATEALTRVLAQDCSCGIVSGLARGIDTVAHTVALEMQAPTIAVLGGGLDRIYPAENKRLAAGILELGGALVSEQPFGAAPRPGHLIARDRIQSGLSAAVLVTQSPIESGTMHTVRFAAAQSRPVFCPVPRSNEPAESGLRVLLEQPASDLFRVLPAWKGARRMCERMASRPLAHPVRYDRMDDFKWAVRDSLLEDARPPEDALFVLRAA